MIIGAVVFGGVCVLFLIGAAIYECCKDKDGEILSDFAHGRIAATALGSIVLWFLALFVVFTTTAVCIAPQFPGRSIYAVAVELALNYKLYASNPIYTAPALAASGVAFVPFLIAAIFGLPIFRNIYAGYKGDYCDDEADAPEAEDFCCVFAPCRRRCGRAESIRRASSSAIASSFAVPGAPRAPLQLPPQPKKFSSVGVMLDYCFTVCIIHFCVTCLYNLSAPVTETGVELWPWYTSIGATFIGMFILSEILNHKFELLEIPSERARNERKQRWRTRHGFISSSEYDHILEDEFGLVEICDTTISRKKRDIEMVPLSQMPSAVDDLPKAETKKETVNPAPKPEQKPEPDDVESSEDEEVDSNDESGSSSSGSEEESEESGSSSQESEKDDAESEKVDIESEKVDVDGDDESASSASSSSALSSSDSSSATEDVKERVKEESESSSDGSESSSVSSSSVTSSNDSSE